MKNLQQPNVGRPDWPGAQYLQWKNNLIIIMQTRYDDPTLNNVE